MDVLAIIEQLQMGETVEIPATDAIGFISECEQLKFTKTEIIMDIDWPKCFISLPARRKATSETT